MARLRRPVHEADLRAGRRTDEVLVSTPAPAVTVSAVVIDVNDLDREIAFWSALLEATVRDREEDWVDIAPLGSGGPMLSLQLVPERKQRKNRLHFDLTVDDFKTSKEQILELGATEVSEVHDGSLHPWQVLADPEGNEFCLSTRG